MDTPFDGITPPSQMDITAHTQQLGEAFAPFGSHSPLRSQTGTGTDTTDQSKVDPTARPSPPLPEPISTPPPSPPSLGLGPHDTHDSSETPPSSPSISASSADSSTMLGHTQAESINTDSSPGRPRLSPRGLPSSALKSSTRQKAQPNYSQSTLSFTSKRTSTRLQAKHES